MIIDRNYDESLWLMLYVDKDNRERIADFIKSVPLELYKQIQESLSYYVNVLSKNKVDTINEYDEFQLSSEIKTTGDMSYWYMINPQTGALDLGECIDDGEEKYDLFQMTLYPLKSRQIIKMENLEDYLLGDIAYDYAEEYVDDRLYVSDCDSREYRLIKLPFGRMLVNSCESFPYVKNRYNLVNMDIVPCNYDVSDLSDKNKLNRLVRGRKLGNSR